MLHFLWTCWISQSTHIHFSHFFYYLYNSGFICFWYTIRYCSYLQVHCRYTTFYKTDSFSCVKAKFSLMKHFHIFNSVWLRKKPWKIQTDFTRVTSDIKPVLMMMTMTLKMTRAVRGDGHACCVDQKIPEFRHHLVLAMGNINLQLEIYKLQSCNCIKCTTMKKNYI